MAITGPTERERMALCEWLTANGIDPTHVPIDSAFAIDDQTDGKRLIRYVEYVLTADGHKQVDPEHPESSWKRPASAPCVVEPPAWLNVPGAQLA